MHTVKRAQKESLFLRTITDLFREAAREDKELYGLSIPRITFSRDGSMCTVFFFTPGGEEEFKQKVERLKLYKPSLRKAVAEKLNQRRTPDFIFKFDKQFAKGERIRQLLDSLIHES